MSLHTNPTPPIPVILNLFQDPFSPTPGAPCGMPAGGFGSHHESTGHAARWVLKQVQDDEEGMSGMACSRVEFSA